jgi:hypothetical protein
MVNRFATAYPLFPSLCPVKHWSKILSMSARDTTPIAPLLGGRELDHAGEGWDQLVGFRSGRGVTS